MTAMTPPNLSKSNSVFTRSQTWQWEILKMIPSTGHRNHGEILSGMLHHIIGIRCFFESCLYFI